MLAFDIKRPLWTTSSITHIAMMLSLDSEPNAPQLQLGVGLGNFKYYDHQKMTTKENLGIKQALIVQIWNEEI